MSIKTSVENKLFPIIEDIARVDGTPFYFFEHQRFINNIQKFKAALNLYHDKVVIGYSFKTNYAPSICKLAQSLGCYAEVVSRVELDLAQKLEFKKGEVIYNGPLKLPKDIDLAVELGAIINFDHIEQIEYLYSYSEEKREKVRAGIRVNIDLNSKLLAKKIAKGGLIPRFGIHTNQLEDAVMMLRDLNIEVVSLHGHCSSSDRAPENYQTIASELLSIRKKFDLEQVQFIDIGGGFAGRVPTIWNKHDTPTFEQYAKAIFSALNADPWFNETQPFVVIEPGMSVVADTVSIVTKVISKKSIDGNLILGADANFYNVRPTFHRKPLTYTKINCKKRNEKEPTEVKALVGATCMERDVLLEDITLNDPQIDDLILIEDVGAYCSVLTPNFINYVPPMYDILPDYQFINTRRKQSFDDFFGTFNFYI